MDRDAMWQVVDSERTGIAELLASLTAAEWAQPSWCAGWTGRRC